MSPILWIAFGVVFMIGLPVLMAWITGVLE